MEIGPSLDLIKSNVLLHEQIKEIAVTTKVTHNKLLLTILFEVDRSRKIVVSERIGCSFTFIEASIPGREDLHNVKLAIKRDKMNRELALRKDAHECEHRFLRGLFLFREVRFGFFGKHFEKYLYSDEVCCLKADFSVIYVD
jgi:hypothetical protein